MALIHEFAWSASRAAGFRECQRAHYYNKRKRLKRGFAFCAL